jgi:hypothetical protein
MMVCGAKPPGFGGSPCGYPADHPIHSADRPLGIPETEADRHSFSDPYEVPDAVGPAAAALYRAIDLGSDGDWQVWLRLSVGLEMDISDWPVMPAHPDTIRVDDETYTVESAEFNVTKRVVRIYAWPYGS